MLLGLAGLASAKPVATETLRAIAQKVLQRSDVKEVSPEGLALCRLFAGADGTGFVLLSTDDCVFPLLGYSLDGTIDFPIAEPIMEWFDGYQREIASAIRLGIPQSGEVAGAWSRLAESGLKRRTEGGAVEPLLQTLWNQSPYYNDWCPYDNTAAKHAPTGCTATATAQVMRYWGHPAQGRGSHSYTHRKYGVQAVNYDTSVYEWDTMPVRLVPSTPQVQKAAVAKLCYEVGVSMDMSYAPSGSGAYAHSGGMLRRQSAELGLKNYFGYNPGMYTAFKEGMTDEEWDDLISEELNAGRPVIYTGSSSTGGHAFVVDGYDAEGLYHVNWGWGGSLNGYYTISHLTMGTAGQQGYAAYNEMNEALIGVYPITRNASTAEVRLVSADEMQGTVSGSGTYAVSSDRVFLRATPSEGYRFSHWASGNRANPIFFYPTIDYADTAYFVPLSNDTLGYCQNAVPNFDTIYSLGHCEWGIRIPASLIPEGKQLEQVQNFIYTTGRYVLKIYMEETPETPVYADTMNLYSYGWRTITLDAPLALDPTRPLWITFTTENVKYPAGISLYTGNPDGSWYKRDGVWAPVDTADFGYMTWSIRGILGAASSIASAEDDGVGYSVEHRRLAVDNPQGRLLSVYDAAGRPVVQGVRQGRLNVQLPAAGVYLLKVDGLPARKIVVK